MEDIEKLASRLEKLESQARTLKKVAAFAVLSVFALLAMGQTPRLIAVPEGKQSSGGDAAIEAKVTAREFDLVDEKGNQRASLVSDGAGSVFLVMFDKNGRPRANMQVSVEGPSLNFMDPNDRSRLIVGSTSMVGSHVASASGIVEKNPPSSIVMFDKDGKLIWRTP